MYNLLVLGLIPGTDIQISFQGWLIMMAVLPFAVKRAKPYAQRWFAEASVTVAFMIACLRIQPYQL